MKDQVVHARFVTSTLLGVWELLELHMLVSHVRLRLANQSGSNATQNRAAVDVMAYCNL